MKIFKGLALFQICLFLSACDASIREVAQAVEEVIEPTVEEPVDIRKVRTGWSHGCFLDSDGSVKCWGDNTFSQIHDQNIETAVLSPYSVYSSGISDIVAGGFHNCAIRSGALDCWGRNLEGQIGNGSTSASVSSPSQVTLGSAAVDVFASGWSTCALLDDASMWCFGAQTGVFNDGDNSWSHQTTPVQISLPTGTLLSFAMSYAHACGVFDTGVTHELHCWGSNHYGEIIDDSVFAYGMTDTLVMSSSTLTQVSLGSIEDSAGGRTCIIDNGTVKCKGDNGAAQVDVGTMGVNATAFHTITGMGEVATQVSANSYLGSCALISNSVKCWGFNGTNLLGSSLLTTDYSGPVEVLTSIGI